MSYNAESIQIKDFRSACRSTPGMYIGTDGQNAAFNCFLEVLNNACDEAIMGRGNTITIKLSDDLDTLTCIDNGAGVPHGPNKDTDEVLIELFTKAHSSGKFDTMNYKKVRGCHGIGTSAVCVCSTSFEIWSRREGAEYYINFKDGIPQLSNAKYIRQTDETGSTFKFTPDKTIFNINTTSFDYDKIKDELELTSYFIPNVTFILEYKDKKEKFISKNGLKDFAKNKIQNPLHKSYIYGYKEFEDEVEVEVFAQWTTGKETRYIFSNGALNSDGGTPETGAKAAFTRTINSLSKGDFDADMIRKGLVYIVNIRHPHPIYQNQTKNKIQNAELRGYTQTVFSEAIKEFVGKHKDEFEKIIEILTKEKKAEAAAEKARKAILEAEKEVSNEKKSKILLADKLKDCRNHGENSILFITEGDSAMNSLALGREGDSLNNCALFPVRGKIISSLKNDTDKVLANEEVKAIFSALGCGFFEKYDARKLRYGRVGIAADQDQDGKNIFVLMTTLFYFMCPDFLKEGRLMRIQSPLYVLNYSKEKRYAMSMTERDQLISTYGSPKSVTRIKGLGELNPDDVNAAIFCAQRHWDRLIVKDWDSFSDRLNLMMSEDVPPRREFIMNNVDFSRVEE